MASSSDFRSLQYAFAAHIRDPGRHPRPAEVDDRRMGVYRELFYNNIAGFLENSFPVLRRLYPDDAWHRMVRDFLARHRCRTPLFHEIPREFLRYLDSERAPQPEDPPFLYELAHYEWVELALSVDEREPPTAGIDPQGALLTGVPVVSPLAWLLSYRYPVHRIAPDFRPQRPSEHPHHLLVYRDRRDEVGFMELNPLTAVLLERLQHNPEGACGREILEAMAQALPQLDRELVLAGGRQALEQLRTADVILGTRRP